MPVPCFPVIPLSRSVSPDDLSAARKRVGNTIVGMGGGWGGKVPSWRLHSIRIIRPQNVRHLSGVGHCCD